MSDGEIILQELVTIIVVIVFAVIIWHHYLGRKLKRDMRFRDSLKWPLQNLFRSRQLEVASSLNPFINTGLFTQIRGLWNRPRMLIVSTVLILVNLFYHGWSLWRLSDNPWVLSQVASETVLLDEVMMVFKNPFSHQMQAVNNGLIAIFAAAAICCIAAIIRPALLLPGKLSDCVKNEGLWLRILSLLFIGAFVWFFAFTSWGWRTMLSIVSYFIFQPLATAALFGVIMQVLLLSRGEEQSYPFIKRILFGYAKGLLTLTVPFIAIGGGHYLISMIGWHTLTAVALREPIAAVISFVSILILAPYMANSSLKWGETTRSALELFRARGIHLVSVYLHAAAVIVLVRLVLVFGSQLFTGSDQSVWRDFILSQSVILAATPLSLALLLEFRECAATTRRPTCTTTAIG